MRIARTVDLMRIDKSHNILFLFKAKVESQMANASLATTNIGNQEPSEAPPPSHFRSTLPVPGASGSTNSSNPMAQSLTMLETVTGSSEDMKTWVSEYNFPAVLSRCKFPKEYDAIHELQTNKYVSIILCLQI